MTFDHPHLLWLLLLAIPIALLGIRSLEATDAVGRWLTIGLRLIVLTILVLMLAGMQSVRTHTDLTVVAVIDRSESVRRFARPLAELDVDPQEATIDAWIKRWLTLSSATRQQDDRFGAVVFDGRASLRSMPSTGMILDASSVETATDGTDAAGAIRLGMALFSADTSRRMVLFWDGNDTVESTAVFDAAREAKAAGIPIDLVPIEYAVHKEVMVEGVYAPPEARQGQTISLRIVLSGTCPAEGTLFLKQDGSAVDINGPGPGKGASIGQGDWSKQGVDTANGAPDLSSQGAHFICVQTVELPMTGRGPSRFEAVFEPAQGADTMAANNRSGAFTFVHGKGKILIAASLPEESRKILPDVLRSRGIDLEMGESSALPQDLAGFQKYDAIVLDNVPAELVTPAQQRMIAQYVNDMGGGLIMVGGPDSFGAGGWTNSPIDWILPVQCQIPNQTILPSGALVLVLDRSGSMAEPVKGSQFSKQEIANEAAVLALTTLFPQDMIGVIAFDSNPKVIAKLQMIERSQQVTKNIRAIHPGGGTNIYPALAEAYRQISGITAEDAAVKHVVLLSDGESQPGPYYRVIGQMVKAGVTLSTVGIGDAANVELLHQLAVMGNGAFHRVQDPKRLPQVFIKEARTIRKNLIKEKVFTPQLRQTGSPIMSGISGVPELRGLVLTSPKHDPRVYLPMLGPDGEPLFAHWQVGLGRVAAFTSDAHDRWAREWLNWAGYADFWSRSVRAVARPAAGMDFDLQTVIANNVLEIKLDASMAGRDEQPASFMNFLRVVGTVLLPDGELKRIKLQQTGPGFYEAVMPATDAGHYIVSLFAQDRSGQATAVFGAASQPVGPELRVFGSNRARLEHVAAITGGRVLDLDEPGAAALFNRETVVESRSLRPMWRSLLVWLLVLFLLDVAVRRITWDTLGMKQWAVKTVAGARERLKTREAQVAATLGALKKRAAEVDQELSQGILPESEPIEIPPAHRKFEAPAKAEPDQDFAREIGGAKIKIDTGDPAPREQMTDLATDTTRRLLDAKRRARQRLDGEEH